MKKCLAVVVLNYENYEDTIECVNSLLSQTYKPFYIVVVENGSANESFNILNDYFSHNDKVIIIRSKKNVGFAKGNNLGILYARKQLNCEYIFVLNSDTVLTTNIILTQLMIDYPKDIALVSPRLIGLNGELQFGHVWSKEKIKKNTIIAIAYTCIDLTPSKFRKLLIKLKRKIYYSNKDITSVSKQDIKPAFQDDKNKYQIQGAAFLLTPTFFKHYSTPYPRTFLYFEEINMTWYLYRANLDTMVINTDAILHKEAKTTSATVLGNKKIQNKAKLMMKSIVKSLPMYFSSYDRIVKKYCEKFD